MSDAIQAISRQVSPAVQQAQSDPSAMDKDDFLKLLVSQMQHQDPLAPEDPSKYTSQLTEFSNLEQLINLNTKLSDLSGLQELTVKMSATDFIGKQATVAGDRMQIVNGQPTSLQFNLPSYSEKTTMRVYDGAGLVVAEIDLGSRYAGDHTYEWDGKNADGIQVRDGEYMVEIAAEDSVGAPVPADTSYQGIVNGVSYQNGMIYLEVDGVQYSLGELTAIEAVSPQI